MMEIFIHSTFLFGHIIDLTIFLKPTSIKTSGSATDVTRVEHILVLLVENGILLLKSIQFALNAFHSIQRIEVFLLYHF